MQSLPFSKLALAGAMAMMLGAGVAEAHVSYNLANAPGQGAAPDDGNNGNFTDGNGGYAGNLPVNWFMEIHNTATTGVSLTANSAGIKADTSDTSQGLAVGAKAYKDGATNWGHNADFAIFSLNADANVTISVSSDHSALRPAFGLWQGWDTGSGSRHGEFLNNGAISAMTGTLRDSTGTSLVDVNAWAFSATQGSAGNDVTATLTRFLTAGNYTLAIGGYDGTVGGQLAYSANISTAPAAAPVPLPAAAWLFGGAIASLVSTSRRRRVLPT